MKKSTLAVVAGSVVAVLAVLVTYIGMTISYHNKFNTAENNLQSHYDSNRALLAGYARDIEKEFQLADYGNQSVLNGLQAAIEGRYKADGSATRPGQASLFSIIQEAYPNLAQNLDLFNKIMDRVNTYETKFFNAQRDLAQEAATFQTSIENFPASWFAGDYPKSNLHALKTDGSGNLVQVTGRAALDQMRALVTSSTSDSSYGNGRFDGPNIPAAPKPAR